MAIKRVSNTKQICFTTSTIIYLYGAGNAYAEQNNQQGWVELEILKYFLLQPSLALSQLGIWLPFMTDGRCIVQTLIELALSNVVKTF